MKPEGSSHRLSRLGAGLCIAYLAIVLVCVVLGLLANADPKGRFVFFQLPIALQGGMLLGLGLGSALDRLSWPVAYLLLGGGTLFGLYFVGAAIERKAKR